jgi:hypothetical protein
MTSLKDKIQQEIRKEREGSDKPGQARGDGDVKDRLDEIRAGLEDLPHTTDKYILKVEYAVGPYGSNIAIVELYYVDGVWAAKWEIAPTVGGSAADWEVTYNPHGVETHHEWFRDADGLFKYLTTSIAERIVDME